MHKYNYTPPDFGKTINNSMPWEIKIKRKTSSYWSFEIIAALKSYAPN